MNKNKTLKKILKKLKKVWHSWATIEHHSKMEFCQATNTCNFKLEDMKMFLRKCRSTVFFLTREREECTLPLRTKD